MSVMVAGDGVVEADTPVGRPRSKLAVRGLMAFIAFAKT